jgi:hypothetical protein
MRIRIELVLVESKRALLIQTVHLATQNKLVTAIREALRSPLAIRLLLALASEDRETKSVILSVYLKETLKLINQKARRF